MLRIHKDQERSQTPEDLKQAEKQNRLCHKNRDAKSGHSNIQNGKHVRKVNNNTNGKKKDDSANHLQVPSNNSTW